VSGESESASGVVECGLYRGRLESFGVCVEQYSDVAISRLHRYRHGRTAVLPPDKHEKTQPMLRQRDMRYSEIYIQPILTAQTNNFYSFNHSDLASSRIRSICKKGKVLPYSLSLNFTRPFSA